MASHPLHEPLLSWYDASARDLPWRAPDATPWGVLVSEVMLQQTPVARVEPVWRRWMASWPTPASLAAATAGDAVRAWDRLGYPRRALRLHAAATAVRERHAGVVPDRLEELLALPGVGGYTAAAVSAFAFGGRHAVVDTNVRRVQARSVTGRALPAPSLTAAEVRLASDLLPDDVPGRRPLSPRWSVAVMELGALVCTARAPACTGCPISTRCRWNALGRPAHTGPRRAAQRWTGTDRQVRGRLLEVLRRAPCPVAADDLHAVWHDGTQTARCLDGLLVDGLLERSDDGRFALPGELS